MSPGVRSCALKAPDALVGDVVRYIVERALQISAYGCDGADNDDGDEGRDEAIFNRRSAGLVT